MEQKYAPLFEPFVFNNSISLKNRIVMAPMTNFSSNPDGSVSDDELKYYARRSSGVSMVITACVYVTPSGKGFPGEFAADRDEMIPSLRRLADTIKGQGAKAVLQIFHGGLKCPPQLVPGGKVIDPSTIESEHIESIVRDFGEATRRAIEAGYDGVEIHGANGYILQQFFSPYTNRRTDRWGGDVQKRLAFPLAIVDEVKKTAAAHAKQPFLIGYRFSPEEEETPGITMADTLVLADAIAEKNIDYVHVSVLDFWSKPRRGVEDTRSRIELIHERIGHRVPVIGVGSIRTADEALQAKKTGIPFIALGRELIIEPDWVQKVEQGRESEIETALSKDAQARLVIPLPLWQGIMSREGWFPMK